MAKPSGAVNQTDSQIVVRSKGGVHYRLPAASLAGFSAPEGTVIIEWGPGRYLVMPPDQIEQYRLSDEDVIPIALATRTRPRRGRVARRRRRVT